MLALKVDAMRYIAIQSRRISLVYHQGPLVVKKLVFLEDSINKFDQIAKGFYSY